LNKELKQVLSDLDELLVNRKNPKFDSELFRDFLKERHIQKNKIDQIIFYLDDDSVVLEKIAIQRKEHLLKLYIGGGVFLFGIVVIVFFLIQKTFIFWPLVFWGIGCYIGWRALKQLKLLSKEKQNTHLKRRHFLTNLLESV
jgi:hypothetical protein